MGKSERNSLVLPHYTAAGAVAYARASEATVKTDASAPNDPPRFVRFLPIPWAAGLRPFLRFPLRLSLFRLTIPAVLALPAAFPALAQPRPATLRPNALAVLDEREPPRTVRRGTERLDAETGAVRAVFRLDERPEAGPPETVARAYLVRHARTLGLGGATLRTARVDAGRFDAHVTLAQTVDGVDLDGATAQVALSAGGTVRQVAHSLNAEAARWAALHRLDAFALSDADAEAVVRRAVVNGPATVVFAGRVALWRADRRDVRPALRLSVYPHSVAEAWTVWVDGATGDVLRVADEALHRSPVDGRRSPVGSADVFRFARAFHPERSEGSPFVLRPPSFVLRPSSFADGQGLAFDPDPLTTSGAAYGTPGFADSSDADTPNLSAQRRAVALPQIAQEGGLYVLKGPYVEITGSPAVGGSSFTPPSEADPTAFRYPRSDKRFEAVMAYHHLDAMQRYVQTLNVGRAILERPIAVNPHGLGPQDNSLFYAATFAIAFGDGGVDDAEDADVLRHEYTHALLHDQQPALFNSTEGRAIHEGYADYVAASASRAAGDPNWRRVYTWDGNNGCWQGRTLDHSGTYSATDRTRMVYPAASGCAAFPTVYQWALLWATTLADLEDDLGRPVMDRLVFGSMAYLAPVASGVPAFEAAAEALLAADRALYAGSHLDALEARFVARGILGERLAPAMAHTPPADRPGATTVSLVVTALPGRSPVASVVARPVADRFADTLALAPVTLVRDGTTDVYRADVAVPAGTVALRYTLVATDAAGRTAEAGPFDVVVRLLRRTNVFADATPSGLWQRFGSVWAAAPRSLAEAESYQPPVSSLSLLPLDLPANAAPIRLVLRHTVALNDGAAARAALSDDDGRTWQQLAPTAGYPRTFAAPGHPLDGAQAFALRDTATAAFDLSRWAGRQVRIRFDLGLNRPIEGGEAWTIRSATLEASTAAPSFQTNRTAAVSTPYPNPFRTRTTFSYTVDASAVVSAEVFDVLGRRVAVLVPPSVVDPGTYPLAFGSVAAGVYVVRVNIGGQTFMKSVVCGG